MMISIRKAIPIDYKMLADLGRRTFLESHAHSGPAEDINGYMQAKYTEEAVLSELEDGTNIYHIAFEEDVPVGYSKIILHLSPRETELLQATKLERLYVLQAFYRLRIGYQLLLNDVELSKSNGDLCMWLYTWIKNERAIAFYQKNHFKIIGNYDFQLSPRHSNPNHLMLFKY